MSLIAGKILGINISLESRKTILEHIEKYLLQSPISNTQSPKKIIKPLVIVTPNPEQIVLAQGNKYFTEILNQADVALPDGVGIVWAQRFIAKLQTTNYKLQTLQRIAGVEFMEDLVAIAAKRSIPIGLIGGRDGLAVKALECLKEKHLGLKGWAQELGELSVGDMGILGDLGDVKKIAKKIQETRTRMVFVGLGAPKQEYFVFQLSKECQLSSVNCQIVMMSVGGSFDIIAGKIQRSPLFIRSIGFEWAWRLVQEPWRWKRQLALLKFIWLVIKEISFARPGLAKLKRVNWLG